MCRLALHFASATDPIADAHVALLPSDNFHLHLTAALLLQMPDAAADIEEPEDNEFELDVEDDDDLTLAKKKQQSSRCLIFLWQTL